MFKVLIAAALAVALFVGAGQAQAKHNGGAASSPIVTNVTDPGDGGGGYPLYTGQCTVWNAGVVYMVAWNGSVWTQKWLCHDGFFDVMAWNGSGYYSTGIYYD